MAALRLACSTGAMKILLPLALLILATTLEAGGDAIIRVGLRSDAFARSALILAGGAALTLDGTVLNLAPLDWGRLVGAYVATFFVVGQMINRLAFGTTPTLPVVVGGALIVAGGLVVTLWRV